jgi:hypothetical protein
MARKSILFSLRADMPLDELPRILSQVQKWRGVQAVGALFPNAAEEDFQRMGYVELNAAANSEELLKHVAALPSVSKAELAADRRLS